VRSEQAARSAPSHKLLGAIRQLGAAGSADTQAIAAEKIDALPIASV
jgi:hypothetical protein